MSKKEKLVALLKEFIEVDTFNNGEFIEVEVNFNELADQLLINGVDIT